MNIQVTPLLTSLSNVEIDKFQIDTRNDIIKFNFSIEGTQNKISEIIFNDVTSFYYMDNNDELPTTEDKNISLNNIMYCGNAPDEFINISSNDDDIAVSVPNFVLELTDSSIFIEANSIMINKQKYVV